MTTRTENFVSWTIGYILIIITMAWIVGDMAKRNIQEKHSYAAAQRCDLAIGTPTGAVLCFDHTDGHGNRIGFTADEQDFVQERFLCHPQQPREETGPAVQ